MVSSISLFVKKRKNPAVVCERGIYESDSRAFFSVKWTYCFIISPIKDVLGRAKIFCSVVLGSLCIFAGLRCVPK